MFGLYSCPANRFICIIFIDKYHMLTHICGVQVSWFYSMSTKPMKYFHRFQKVESLWWLISNTKNRAEERVDHVWLPRQGIKGTVDSSWHDSVLLLFSFKGTSQSWRCSGSPVERPRWRGPEASCRQPCECTILEAHPSGSVKPLDGWSQCPYPHCGHMWDPEPKLPG